MSTTVVAEKLKEVSRHERKKYNASAEYLRRLIGIFFEKTHGKTSAEIQAIYTNHDNAWRGFAKQFNRKQNVTYLDVASFETAILGGIKKIKESKVSAQAKLQMIRTVRLLGKKNLFIGFLQDIPLWWKFAFNERKTLHRG